MTTLEIVLTVALVILLIQYCLVNYVWLSRSNNVDTCVETINDMQKYNDELFQKLIKEEKLTIALSQQLKAYRERYGTGGEDKISGLN